MPTASRSAAADRQARQQRQLRLLAAVPLLVAVLAPNAWLENGPAICLFRRATGRPCPTCGLTRSWGAVSRLDLRRAFAHHPFGPPTFAAALLLALGARLPALPDRRGQALAVPLVGAWLATWLRRLAGASSA